MAEHEPAEIPEVPKQSNTLALVTFWVLVVVVLYIGVGTWIGIKRQNDTANVANQGQDLASQVAEACAKGGDVARQLGPLCQQANELKNIPAPGPSGAKGEPGPTGVQGPPGERGIAGPVGPQGPIGPQGPVGDTGQAGSNGQNGSQGVPGPKGDPGPAGPPGADGAPGATGPKGDRGEPAASWTWTDPVTGFTYTCTRSNTDDEHPTYACS